MKAGVRTNERDWEGKRTVGEDRDQKKGPFGGRKNGRKGKRELRKEARAGKGRKGELREERRQVKRREGKSSGGRQGG